MLPWRILKIKGLRLVRNAFLIGVSKFVNFVAVFHSCVRLLSFRYRSKALKDWSLILLFMSDSDHSQFEFLRE